MCSRGHDLPVVYENLDYAKSLESTNTVLTKTATTECGDAPQGQPKNKPDA